MSNPSYKDLKILKGLEGIQTRPGMYIGDVSTNEAVHNMLWEVLYNSIDEHIAGYGNKIDVIFNAQNNWVMISDEGRGIPTEINLEEKKSNLEIAFTYIHAGGKFNDENYRFSSGLHGVGITVVNALSKYVLACSKRDSVTTVAIFVNGNLVSFKQINTPNIKTGTFVIFSPNEKYFENYKFDKELINKKLSGISFLYPNLNTYLTSYYGKNNTEYISYIGQKLDNFLRYENMDKKPIFIKPFIVSYKEKECEIEIVFNWYEQSNTRIRAFCNGLEQTNGGTHLNGFIKELKSLIDGLSSKDKELNISTVKEGLSAVINLKINNPTFSSQTKERLTNSSVMTTMRKLFKHNNELWIKRARDLTRIIDFLYRLEQKKIELLKVKGTILESDSLMGGGLPGKLLSCKSKNIKINEIWITEGISAGGTAKAARDSFYQAIIAIRGKIINVERANLSRIIKFESIKNMLLSIGTGLGDNFDISKLRYGKIIFMTDADCDGYQIRALLTALFYKYLKDLIVNGHIFIAQPPLFRLRENKNDLFFLNRTDLEIYLMKKSGYNEIHYNLFKNIYRKVSWDLTKFLKIQEVFFEENSIGTKIIRTTRDIWLIFGFIGNPSVVRINNSLMLDIKRLKGILPIESRKTDIFSRIIKILDLANWDVYRFKGLGQMNSDELWEHVMDPETRSLIKLEIGDAEKTYQDYLHIMGSDTIWRKKLISDSNLSFYDLDV